MICHAKRSVIIPSNHHHVDLYVLLDAIFMQSMKANEIILIDSYNSEVKIEDHIKKLCNYMGVEFQYEYHNLALPGYERNRGLDLASGDIIFFIDVKTIPKNNWIELSLKNLIETNSDGVWGKTSFIFISEFEKLVRDCFYGEHPSKTLPGSVFKKSVFTRSGQFIDWVRAGEDTEWILRLELLHIPISNSNIQCINYIGLVGINKKKLINKWLRNYTSSSELPQFSSQKIITWLVLYPMLVLIAFKWNDLFAKWHTDSIFYIDHITKLVFFAPILFYVFLRGLFIPFNRGVSLSKIFPFRFIQITSLCLLADGIKIFVFLVPKFVKNSFFFKLYN